MKKYFFYCALFVLLFNGCTNAPAKKERLSKASREDKNGWIYVHLEGSPSDIGYQHGYLLENDIDTSIQSVAYLLQHDTHRDWNFYRSAARNFLWDKLCLLYTSPSPRDRQKSRMPSSA